jgi:hypothetical protein
LYPESHGIVSDEFFDAQINATFSPFSAEVNDQRWWKAEPIWATVRKQVIKNLFLLVMGKFCS